MIAPCPVPLGKDRKGNKIIDIKFCLFSRVQLNLVVGLRTFMVDQHLPVTCPNSTQYGRDMMA